MKKREVFNEDKEGHGRTKRWGD